MNLPDYPTPKTDACQTFEQALTVSAQLEREAAAWKAVAEMYRNTYGVTGLDEADDAFDTLKSKLTQP
jgi:hypothetical protein